MQIIVLGAHRSGTSLVTRLINMMGAYFDAGNASIGFNDENPKGFWERSDVIACNEAILQHYNSSWERLEHWKGPTASIKKLPKELEANQDRMKKIVLDLDAHRPWVMKDPRLCMTFPYWKPLLEVPVMVVMYRDPVEVAVSLRQRNGFSLPQGLAMWEYYAVGIVNAIKDMPVVYVQHRDMLEKPVATVETLLKALKEKGVRELEMPTEREITAFIEPSLHRSKSDDYPHREVLTGFQQELIGFLKGTEKPPSKALYPSKFATDVMRGAESSGKQQQVLAETNERLAAIDQERNELKSQIEMQQLGFEERLRELEQEKHVLMEKIGHTYASTSWRLGHGIVNLARKLTFQG